MSDQEKLPFTEDDELLTVEYIAGVLKVTKNYVQQCIRSGELGVELKIGREYRILRSEFNRYLSDRKVHKNDNGSV